MNDRFLIFRDGGVKRMPVTESNSAGVSSASEEHTKVCKSCGRELPLSSFHLHSKSKDGHMAECIECGKRRSKKQIAKNAKSNPLAQFTARELMRELKYRGYEGILEYTLVQKINISDM